MTRFPILRIFCVHLHFSLHWNRQNRPILTILSYDQRVSDFLMPPLKGSLCSQIPCITIYHPKSYDTHSENDIFFGERRIRYLWHYPHERRIHCNLENIGLTDIWNYRSENTLGSTNMECPQRGRRDARREKSASLFFANLKLLCSKVTILLQVV